MLRLLGHLCLRHHQVLGAVLNVILDPVFIFVFDMHAEGAAIATVISQAASFCWVAANAFRKTPSGSG